MTSIKMDTNVKSIDTKMLSEMLQTCNLKYIPYSKSCNRLDNISIIKFSSYGIEYYPNTKIIKNSNGYLGVCVGCIVEKYVYKGDGGNDNIGYKVQLINGDKIIK